MGVRVTHQMGTRVSPFFSHGCCCSSSCSLGQQGHFVLCFPNWKGEPNGLFNNIIRGEDRISSSFVKKEEKKTNLEGIEGRSDGLETFLKLLNGREKEKKWSSPFNWPPRVLIFVCLGFMAVLGSRRHLIYVKLCTAAAPILASSFIFFPPLRNKGRLWYQSASSHPA